AAANFAGWYARTADFRICERDYGCLSRCMGRTVSSRIEHSGRFGDVFRLRFLDPDALHFRPHGEDSTVANQRMFCCGSGAGDTFLFTDDTMDVGVAASDRSLCADPAQHRPVADDMVDVLRSWRSQMAAQH